MTMDPKPLRHPKLQEYLQGWGESLAGVLQQVAGAPHTWKEIPPEAVSTLAATLIENSVGVQFEVADHLQGNQGFVLSTKDAVRLSQLLLMEPEDGSATLNDDRRDAVGELFRQFAGAAASSVKGLAGGEVSFKWVGLGPFPGEPNLRVGFEWSSPGLTPLSLIADFDSKLVEVLSPPNAQPLDLPAPSAPGTNLEKAPDPKLELLMDVELDVTLRFGERQLALREILELTAGSVVELDQQVQDPVELLVGKKVIARGEVVVVDGSYALRVMHIVSPIERIESLRN